MGEISQELKAFFTSHQEDLAQKKRVRVLRDNRPGINLISNDYHGFSREPIDTRAPSGAGGSRLLGGNHPEITQLEKHIAHHLGAESCLVFPSGYQCHQSVLETLIVSRQFTVIYDHLNHASLLAGCHVPDTPRYKFRHMDVEDCAKKISAARAEHPHRTPLIVIESIHSMDGALTPLKDFIALKKSSQSCLALDEAHAVGICGIHHLGLSDELGCVSDVDIILGTFSKGLGVQGAYVATSTLLKDYLLNRCRGFIYTTGLSPALADTIHARLHRLDRDPGYVRRLRDRISRFGSLSSIFNSHHPLSPIFKIEFSSIDNMYEGVDWFEERGIIVGAIRPPTFPNAMIRICINCALSDKDWQTVLTASKHFFQTIYKHPCQE